MVSTSKGCFWLKQPSSDWLLSKVLPAVDGRDGKSRLGDFDSEPLIEAGILESHGIDVARFTMRSDATPRIHSIRTTALSARILDLLKSEGFVTSPDMQPGDFILADLSSLPDVEAFEVIGAINRSACTSICIWKRGNEVFLGPITIPGVTACWHCSRLRLADSLDDVIGAVEDDPQLQMLSQSTLHWHAAIRRLPDLAAYLRLGMENVAFHFAYR